MGEIFVTTAGLRSLACIALMWIAAGHSGNAAPAAKASTAPDPVVGAASAATAAASAASAAERAALTTKKAVDDLKASFVSSDDRLEGDKVTLRTRVTGFTQLDGSDTAVYCAASEAELTVDKEIGGALHLRFLKMGARESNVAACPENTQAQLGVAYRLSRAALMDHSSYRRVGFSFGALLVPFKFRTGVKELIAAPTVAPYIGWRTGWFNSYGLTFTPLISAGVALTPVVNPDTQASETKAAFSICSGLVLSSSKNEKFQAGFVFGRDYLNKTDLAADPNSKKVWVSLYTGFSM